MSKNNIEKEKFKEAINDFYEAEVWANLIHKFGIKLFPANEFTGIIARMHEKTYDAVADALGYKIEKITPIDKNGRRLPAQLFWIRKADNEVYFTNDFIYSIIGDIGDYTDKEKRNEFADYLWDILCASDTNIIKKFVIEFSTNFE